MKEIRKKTMNSRKTTRREFLLNTIRLGTAAILSIGGILLSLRKRPVNESVAHKCIGDNYCSECPISDECVLPLAISRRLATKQKR